MNWLFKPLLFAASTFLFILIILPLAVQFSFFWFEPQVSQTGLTDLFSGVYLKSFKGSVIIASGTACCAGILGTLQAILLQRMRIPGSGFFKLVFFVPFLIPPYIHAIIWTRTFAAAGSFLGVLPWAASGQIVHDLLYGRTGVVFILTLSYFPLVTAIVSAGLNSIARSKEEVALLSCHPGTVLSRITLPLLTPHILGSSLLVMLLALNNFDVPDMLRVRVIPVEIFIQLSVMYDEAGAFLMSLPLLLIATVLAFIVRFIMRGKKYFSAGHGSEGLILFQGRWPGIVGMILLSGISVISVVLPVSVLVAASPAPVLFFHTVAGSADEIFYSLLLAGASGLAIICLSFPIAYLLARKHPWQGAMDLFALLSFAMPAALFSLGLIRTWNLPLIHTLSSTSLLCLFGLVSHFFFVGVKIQQAGLEQISPRIEEVSLLAKISKKRMIGSIILPQLQPVVLAGFFLIFICCFGELSATLLLVPPGRETVAIKIYNIMHYGADDMVASLCLAVTVFMLFSGLLVKQCQKWMVRCHSK